jgi:DNA repair exonuclease SbcCD ATPase subunit
VTAVRLLAIEIEGFRGFAKEQRLSLDAEAVLVRGDNGSGKTSLVDAFLWLFCGELEYLSARVSRLRQNEDVVRSRFTDVASRVMLELEADGQHYSFTRTGSQKAASLDATRDRRTIGGAEESMARVFGHGTPESLRDAVLSWGVLRQDAVRATLDTAGGALHQRLAGIVGLGQVSGFAIAASQAARALQTERTSANRAIQALRQRCVEAVERREAVRRDVEAGAGDHGDLGPRLRQLAERLPAGIAYNVREGIELSEVEVLGRALGRVLDALVELTAARRAATTLDDPSTPSVEAADVEVESARRQLASANREGPAAVRLAQAALEVLEGDTCPVCGQDVDHASLRAHLEETAAHANELVSKAQEASDALARASSRLSEAREHERLRAQHEQQAREAEAATMAALAAIDGLSVGVPLPGDPRELEVLSGMLGQFVEDLRELYRTATAAGGAHLRRLADEADALERELGAAQDALHALQARYERAKALERGAHTAADRIVTRALDQLGPSFAEVFDRLNPNPAFTELRARQDVLRNVNQVVPVVRDPLRGVEANPLLVFSEGQLNVVALSYFLGMALNARDAMLPFLILDDPLQALDTIAVLGFGDLCRRMRDHRQLLITTHDRRFADILARKLAPREPDVRTIVHEFEGWTRDGPSIQTTEPEVAEVIPLLRRAS